ncbi:MAG: AAA family ATPase [Candidatus Eremiobacteraeota bacterium]|nr:AAA family ATPase [Candidatus Eremiobacteraeota bacterium]
MRFRTLRVDGFGRLADRAFVFGPGLNVVVGPNEAGKSTLAAALVAALYGLQRGEKDRWRPWNGAAYATTLTYETADGGAWEVQRAFERDTKGVRVYDASGTDVAAKLGDGRTLNPGEAHLRIPLEVFVQTACVRQRAIAFDGAEADVSTALAQALDGGPKEDAALGAIARLSEALRAHVGTERAYKNAPLKKLRALEEQQQRASEQARATLDGLATLRERIAAERARRDRDAAAAAELERRTRSLHAAHLRARLAALKEYRDELAALQTARAAFDDVASFAADRVGALDDAYHAWRGAEGVAAAAEAGIAEEALSPQERDELAERKLDAGTLDDDAYAALRAAAAQAESAHAKVASASNAAAVARRDGDGGRTLAGALVASALVATLADVGVAIAHEWLWTAVVSAVALVLVAGAFARARSRAARRREADARQRIADAAVADERIAADTVARVLEPLRITTVDELVRRRERFVALAAREAAARKAETRAHAARTAAAAAAAHFDALAATLVADADGDRTVRRTVALQRAARRQERDGLEARLAMLGMRRGDILHGDDDFALQAEYEALLAEGVEPAAEDDPHTLRALERERAELDARAREAERHVAELGGELRAGEAAVPDVAALDEALAATRNEIARLDAFRRAIELARDAIGTRKDEAHRAFARRLEQYSADVLGTITGGRYGEIRLSPTTLAITVRVPETGAIEELDLLSSGTRDQVALVVRFATARMFAEGLETPPLLLDDPFAYWDDDRIARCLPVLIHGALATQCILFTASTDLADAAAEAGATRIELTAATVPA